MLLRLSPVVEIKKEPARGAHCNEEGRVSTGTDTEDAVLETKPLLDWPLTKQMNRGHLPKEEQMQVSLASN